MGEGTANLAALMEYKREVAKRDEAMPAIIAAILRSHVDHVGPITRKDIAKLSRLIAQEIKDA